MAPQLGQFPRRQSFEGPGPRHRSGAGLEDQLDASVRREAGRWPPKDVGELGLERREGGVVLPVQSERGIGEPEGRKVELRADSQPLGAVNEPWKPGQWGEASATTRPTELPLTSPAFWKVLKKTLT